MSRKTQNRSRKAEPSLTAEWRGWYKDKGPILRFCLKFGVLLALYYALMATPYLDQSLYRYLQINARISSSILNLFGLHTQVTGITILSPQFCVEIQRGCDAVEPTWIVLAGIVASQAPLAAKLWGFLAGAILLQVLNLIRIMSLYWIGFHAPSIFNTVHMEIWPVVFLLTAIVVFIYWKEWSSKQVGMNATE